MLYEDRLATLPLGMRRTLMMKTGRSGWYRAGEIRRTEQGVEVIDWPHWDDPWDASHEAAARSWFVIHRPSGGVMVIATSRRRVRK